MSDNDDVISDKAAANDAATSDTPAAPASPASNPFRDMAVYGLLRLLLFIALTAFIMGVSFLIDLPVPLLIAAMLALIVAFPLSMLLWSDLRKRVNLGMAQWSAERKRHKQSIRQQLADREEQ